MWGAVALILKGLLSALLTLVGKTATATDAGAPTKLKEELQDEIESLPDTPDL